MTPQQRRRIRIGNDFHEMQNIQGAMISWRALRGTPPHVDSYELTANVKSIVSVEREIKYREIHVMQLLLPPNYPDGPPEILMLTSPPPYHPNWFTNGKWCFGTWLKSEGLGHYVVRMLRTLQFDPDITNVGSAANKTAAYWYVENRGKGLFPCDRQTLPDPTQSKHFVIEQPEKTFQME